MFALAKQGSVINVVAVGAARLRHVVVSLWSRVQIPRVQYTYPYHGPWYDLQQGEYREHTPLGSSPPLVATPTPTLPLTYHPTPPPTSFSPV